MNTKYTDSRTVAVNDFNRVSARRHSSLCDIARDQTDYWTPLMSAFLVACLLTALAMCSWQVGDWNHSQTVKAQPVVANQSFSVKADRTF